MTTRIQVGPITYDVLPVDPGILPEKARGWLGFIDYRDSTIWLVKPQKPQVAAISYLHEIFHAILWNAGYVASEQEKLDKVIDTLATGFINVVRENPEILRLTTGEDLLQLGDNHDGSTLLGEAAPSSPDAASPEVGERRGCGTGSQDAEYASLNPEASSA